jgi:two-component system chemotaxis response regulator CheB
MIRVLIAEDSATSRELLRAALALDPELEVVGEAVDGQEAVALVQRLRPHVVTMDVRMPGLDGFAATQRIMAEAPTPVVIVTSHDVRDLEFSLQALRAGALTALPKPPAPTAARFEAEARALCAAIKAMAEVDVVRQFPPLVGGSRSLPERSPRFIPDVLAIAASTGGPRALEQLLSRLPATLPIPVLVVQHIAPGFVEGLAAWLARSSMLRVKVAAPAEKLLAGTVYLAPEDRHLLVDRERSVVLSAAPPEGGFRPSANPLFRTVAEHHAGRAIAAILTGMGRDGVDGLGAVKAAGGWVVAQDEGSSTIFGMPQAALDAGLVDVVLSPPALAEQLVRWTRGSEDR